MEHLSITFPKDLRRALDREARLEQTKRSTLIQKAVRIYLRLKRQGEVQSLLKEGYREMAGESSKLIKDFEDLDRDSLHDHCPLTTKSFSKEYPTNVNIPKGVGGLEANSTVLLSQIRTVDKLRLETKLGTPPPATMKKVDAAIKLSLSLP